MHLRPVTLADLPDMTTIANEAFSNDEFNRYLKPHRDEYPEALRRWSLEHIRKRFFTPAMWAFVCVEVSSTGQEEIMGQAFWHRQSTTKVPFPPSRYLCSNQGVSAKVEQALGRVTAKYNDLIGNPAINSERIRAFENSPPSHDGFLKLPERWYLASLAVSPKHQRKGVGNMLVQWGLDRCKEEAKERADGKVLPAGLISSPPGQKLYSKMGFKVGYWYGEGMNMAGGASMIWDPEHNWVRPVEEKDGIVLKGGKPVEVVYRNTDDEKTVEEARAKKTDTLAGESKKVVVLADEEQKDGVLAAPVQTI